MRIYKISNNKLLFCRIIFVVIQKAFKRRNIFIYKQNYVDLKCDAILPTNPKTMGDFLIHVPKLFIFNEKIQ